jgi:hypothetical protein
MSRSAGSPDFSKADSMPRTRNTSLGMMTQPRMRTIDWKIHDRI